MALRMPFAIASAVLALSLPSASVAGAAVHLAMLPESLLVAPGDTVMLELRVPLAGSAFNGYDAIVEYDPSRLTFLPASPLSQQEGPDMKNACGNTFHVFRAGGDSLSISHVLLCANLSLTGPSVLYRLRFRTALTPGATHVRLRRAQFYLAGTYVNPCVTADAFVSWGGVLGTAPDPVVRRLALTARSNPSAREQWLDLVSPDAGPQRLLVYDPAGRLVRHLDSGHHPAGRRSVRWDGRSDAGARVPPGLYIARLEAGGATARATLIRLP